MQQKSQQQGWSEHNARLGSLADCAKKKPFEVKAMPRGGNISASGQPQVTVNADVNIYEQPGGVGNPVGILRKNSSVSLTQKRPDQWCGVSGKAVEPKGHGYVWCGEGFELDR